MRAAADRVDVRLLGVVVDLTGRTARATVYQAVAGADGDVITATEYRLVHAGDQWRIDTVGPQHGRARCTGALHPARTLRGPLMPLTRWPTCWRS